MGITSCSTDVRRHLEHAMVRGNRTEFLSGPRPRQHRSSSCASCSDKPRSCDSLTPSWWIMCTRGSSRFLALSQPGRRTLRFATVRVLLGVYQINTNEIGVAECGGFNAICTDEEVACCGCAIFEGKHDARGGEGAVISETPGAVRFAGGREVAEENIW
jgi:hypothetical protein